MREELDSAAALAAVEDRDNRDRNRYLRLYHIDVDDYGLADMVVDTEKGQPPYVVEVILAALRERQSSSSR
jgi:cytidylate kinase